ncbi:protein NnrT [Tropicibacter oceani]|uniref:Protein NnrT n=1 Tax=Tropicibacter oceani TaxID=3058420 RepID=A0ABY8QLV5_9RHOB|nr:protein NnrT [Tropicibacter oceani]WGW05621.1 protein NnrT [Tropicibacter oceani]
MRVLAILFAGLAAPAFAAGFDRPIPQAQSATAEFWFGLGSLALIVALVVVQRLVSRR